MEHQPEHQPAQQPTREPAVAEQVALAIRARRRALGTSQRAYAARTGLSKAAVARLESHAGRIPLEDVAHALAAAGFDLVVVPRGQDGQAAWEATDLVARTRGGSRFPAHLEVRPTTGPGWWFVDEMWRRRRPLGPAPRWTTEGARSSLASAIATPRGYGDPGPWGRADTSSET